jgi:hypothetical protein
VGGSLKASDGTLRMIVGHQTVGGSVVLTLMRPILQLSIDIGGVTGTALATAYPGCDKSTATCRDKFHNLGNHGGCPGITGINPFSGISNVF